MTNSRTDLSNVQLHLVNSVEEAEKFLRWLGERRPHNALAVDIETGEGVGRDKKDALSPWHGDIRLVQVGDGEQGWAIPWKNWSGVFYQGMKQFDGLIICHNIAFEAKWFAVKSEWELPWIRAHDTMIMARIIDPLGAAGLKPLSAKYIPPSVITPSTSKISILIFANFMVNSSVLNNGLKSKDCKSISYSSPNASRSAIPNSKIEST
jgi:hypothetical protein